MRRLLAPFFVLSSIAAPALHAGGAASPQRQFEIPRIHPPAQPCGLAKCGLRETPIEPKEVRLATGEYVHQATDLSIPGIGIDFVWSRTYRSRADGSGAMGSGWDFSYNVRAERHGSGISVYDGAGGVDVYAAGANGKYATLGTHCEGEIGSSGHFVLTFPDSGRWVFAPFDDTPAAGRLLQIVDRNSNKILLEYDKGGRLVTIVDSLRNRYVVSYTPDGLVSSLSASHGRVVTYAYGFRSVDESNVDSPDGRKDLVAVITPHDEGEDADSYTTMYEYTAGQCLPELDHNLTRIIGPGGVVALENRYGSTCDSSNVEFDRLVTSIDSFGRSDIAYEHVAAAGLEPRLVVFENDQVGNVTEYIYDQRGRRVEERTYTGRADPAEPTTRLTNRPGPSLRQREPVSYITRWEWNDEDLLTRMIKPNGLAVELVYESDLNPTASRRQRANLRHRSMVAGNEGATGRDVVATQDFEYAASLGGCCGGTFVTMQTDLQGTPVVRNTVDSRGNTLSASSDGDETEYIYNDIGQLIRIIHADNGCGHRREDAFEYYTSGPAHQIGRLWKKIVDETALALVTTYEWDIHGKISRETDPRGNDWVYIRALSGALVRVDSPELTTSGGAPYRVGYDVTWTPSTRVVQIDVDNRDENGTVLPNAKLTSWFTLDMNQKITRIERELDSSDSVVEERQWNYQGRQTLMRFGEAVNGNQPTNTVHFQYDTLGRPFQRIEASGGSTQSTMQLDYDSGGNLMRVTRCLECTTPQITDYVHDSLGRLTSTTDSMGNVRYTTFDTNGQLLWEMYKGAPQSGGSAVERLFEASYTYDSEGRRLKDEVKHFAPNQAAIGDGVITTERTFSPFGQLLDVTEDDKGVWSRCYDTANRLAFVTDPLGNRIELEYDDADNLTVERLIEMVPGSSSPVVTTWTSAYDAQDRRELETDNMGGASIFQYDSLSNCVRETDRRANVTLRSYDGAGRLLSESHQLTATGLGGGAPVAWATIAHSWDDTGRPVAIVDAMGQVTRQAYDPNNRLIASLAADGTLSQIGQGATWALGVNAPDLTAFTSGYDGFGNRRVVTSAAGSVVTTNFDGLNRPSNRSIVAGAGVFPSTTAEVFMYDGLSRLIAGANDGSLIGIQYDSTSASVSETIHGRTTLKTTDGLGGTKQLIYPNGRTIDVLLDKRGRKDKILEGAAQIADYDYVGTYRPHRRINGNGTVIEDAYDAGRRAQETLHRAGSTVFDRRTYGWDAGDNKTSHTDQVTGTGARTWEYDSLERMVRSVRPSGTTSYTLDLSGNRTQVTGGAAPGTYAASATLPEPADAQMNQYTTTPGVAMSWDLGGNPYLSVSTGGATRARLFDYRNRMIADYDPNTMHGSMNTYDVLGRRISKLVNGPSGMTVTEYNYDGWQVVQETDTGTGAVRTFVQGHEIDEVIQMRSSTGDYYYHTDDKYSVQAVTNASGVVVERYEYDDYGRPSIFDASMAPRSVSAIGNTNMFQGRNYDAETGLYYFRHRFLDPRSGRFVTRDPMGAWHDAIALGNAYSFLNNNPQSWVDPFGLQTPTPKQREENREEVFGVFYGIATVSSFVPVVGWILGPVFLGIVGLADYASQPPEYCEIQMVSTTSPALQADLAALNGLPLKMCLTCPDEQNTCPIGTKFTLTEWNYRPATTTFQYTTNTCDEDCDFPSMTVYTPTKETTLPREMQRQSTPGSTGTTGTGGGH